MAWLIYAFASALAAAATAILAKIGVEGVPSTLATALRTAVVLVIAWAMVLALGAPQCLGVRGSFYRCPGWQPASRGWRIFALCNWARRRAWRRSTSSVCR
jgi:hypothetical protein